MNRLLLLLTSTIILTFYTTFSLARNETSEYSIVDALNTDSAKTAFGSDIQFYYGSQTHSKILKTFGEFRSNKKTNAFNKSDAVACNWAFLSAMKSLLDRALREGGNAVINIKSNYRGNETTSSKKFKCGAGNVIAGVALKGTVVTLK